MDLQAVYLAVGSLFVTLAFKKAMDIFFGQRRTSRKIILISSLFVSVFLNLSSHLLPHDLLIRVFSNLVLVLLFSLNYKASVIKRLAVVSSIYLMAVTYSGILAYVYEFTILSRTAMFDGVLMYLTMFLFARKFKYIGKSTIYSNSFWIPSLIMTNIALILIVQIFNNIRIIPPVVWLLLSFVLLIVSFISFYLFDSISEIYEEKCKSDFQAQEKEYYLAQWRLMQESVEQAKSAKHDMKFHLATIRDFIENNKANEATGYLNCLIGHMGKKEIYSETGNIVFDSIINFKLNNAKIEGFKPEIRLLIPLSLNIEVADIVTILGNLLDNAFNALTNINTPDKMLKLDIEFRKGSLFIKVDNSFDGVVKYDAGKDGDTSHIITRKDSNNHGYGLKNIRKSAEKYNGHIDISYSGNIFSVGVLLYVDDLYPSTKQV